MSPVAEAFNGTTNAAASAASNSNENIQPSVESLAANVEATGPNIANNAPGVSGREKRQAGPGPGPGPGQGPILGNTQDSVNKEYEFLG